MPSGPFTGRSFAFTGGSPWTNSLCRIICATVVPEPVRDASCGGAGQLRLSSPGMPERPILIVSGTNRPQSNAARVAAVLQRNYEKLGVAHEVLSLVDLPREVFDGAAYASKPPGMVAIQKRVLDALGLHVVTPEYNGSFPGVLKYFIDMLKFPDSFID